MHRVTGFLKTPMMLIRRVLGRLWVRVTIFAILSLVMAFVGVAVEGLIGPRVATWFGPEALMPVLTILASSMLAVSTFSLNVMVSAHFAAASSATPRLHRLLLRDKITQSVLATFIGAFVYALTTIILFQAGLYPDRAAVVVMAVTVLVTVMVVAAMLRWIDHLSSLGSLEESLRKVTDEARQGLRQLARRPALGGVVMGADTVIPDQAQEVRARKSGYVQILDVAGIEARLPGEARAYVLRVPGKHVLKGDVLARVSGHVDEAALREMAGCFVIGDIRTFEEDPEFGLVTLSEIASKALSPGINDPGTAIAVIRAVQELLWEHAEDAGAAEPPVCPRVFVPVPGWTRLIEAGFAATARDGAGTFEVALQLQQALDALGGSGEDGLAPAAQAMAARAVGYADLALPLESERMALKEHGGA